MPKLNLEGIKQICLDLTNKVKNSFITNITVVNKDDLLLSFSFYNKEKLLISFNHQTPFIGFVDKNYSPHTELGGLNDNLRKYVKGAYINNVGVVNDDRILKMSLYKSDEFFEKKSYSLILEFIPTIANLLFLNDKDEIIFAKHYADLSASRPIIKGMKYLPISKNSELKSNSFDYEKYQQEVKDYILESDHKKQKERVMPLYRYLKQKSKSLQKKIVVLHKELEESHKNLVYKKYGETLLTYAYDEEELNKYINILKDIYDISLSAKDNAEIFFNKYKKNKRAIEHLNIEIDNANKELEEINHYLGTFDYLAEEEIQVLIDRYLPHKANKRKTVISADNPYYIELDKTKIGFGKNKEQNNNLTFKKANKSHTFLHLKDVHSSHVVIFNDKPSKEELELAGEIALILSNKEEGEIEYAKISDIKKGPEKGLVILNKYQTFVLRKVNTKTKMMLKEQKRFN